MPRQPRRQEKEAVSPERSGKLFVSGSVSFDSFSTSHLLNPPSLFFASPQNNARLHLHFAPPLPPSYPSTSKTCKHTHTHARSRATTAASSAAAGGGGFGGGSSAAAAAAAGGKGGSAASAAAAGGRKMLQFYTVPDLTFSRPLGVVSFFHRGGEETGRKEKFSRRRRRVFLLTFNLQYRKFFLLLHSKTRQKHAKNTPKTERVPPGRHLLLRSGHRQPVHLRFSDPVRAPAHAAADAADAAADAREAAAAARRDAAAGPLARGDDEAHGERCLAGADVDLKGRRRRGGIQ